MRSGMLGPEEQSRRFLAASGMALVSIIFQLCVCFEADRRFMAGAFDIVEFGLKIYIWRAGGQK